MLHDEVLRKLHGGDPAGALALANRAAASDEEDARFLSAKGATLLANGEPTAALVPLRAALALGDTGPATDLNLALAEQQSGDPGGLLRMQQLADRMPDWDEPPLRIAEALRASGKTVEAEAAYRRTLERNPRRVSALLGLSSLLIMRGEGEAARDLLLRCCTIAPDRADAWDTLGLALALTQEIASAAAAFAEAHRLEPRSLGHLLHRIDAAISADAESDLLSELQEELSGDPLNESLLIALGVLLERSGQVEEAIDALEAASRLAPASTYTSLYLGGALIRRSRVREAEALLRIASERDPDNGELRDLHATAMLRLYRHADARRELLDCLERHGERPGDLCNLANATNCLGLQEEAERLTRRAIELDPESSWPRKTLCNVLPYCDGFSGAEVLAAMQDCSARLERSGVPPLPSVDRSPDRQLVVGLLSGSFRAHPVAWLTVAGLEALDPGAFRLICLAQNSSEDWMTRRYRAMAAQWCDVGALSDAALAMKARELGIDILIDLGGYGEAGRMTACAYRLAPVQAKWVGMQSHSSGLPEMDWIITDRWETPPELEHIYSERPLRLRDGYVCYSPPPYAPDVGPLPALKNGHITFGCFNNLAKITPTVLQVWSAVLHRVPSARLVLKTHQFADPTTNERILTAFAGLGIGRERIDLRGPSGHRRFLDEYNDIDIVLDPFPYSGGLTTCEALWMGVPTVTMPGELFAGRHSLSHLRNAGLTDWVAWSQAEYIELAATKASAVSDLSALRSALRQQVMRSPLCDAVRFGDSLGAALRFAWQATESDRISSDSNEHTRS